MTVESMPTSPDALPWAQVNGRLIRARQAAVSIFDRSFQLGDGLFETIRILNGWPVQWRQHWRRLAASAHYLQIELPFNQTTVLAQANELITRNQSPEAVLRIQLSRGCGPRGYSPRGARQPQLVMAMFEAPALSPARLSGVRLGIASFTGNSNHRLQQIKTASRVLHVLARAEADTQGFDDALLLDDREQVLEATSSNFFWFSGRTLVTPPLTAGVLPGITRATVLKLASRLGIPVQERLAPLGHILRSQGAFLTVSTSGVIDVREIAGHPVPTNPNTARLHAALITAWQREATRGRALCPRELSAPSMATT
jgi:aminodeoxychorismate lyase